MILSRRRDPDPRSVYRAYLAASQFEPKDHREAALIGALVNAAIARKGTDKAFIADDMVERLEWFCVNREFEPLLPNRLRPLADEIVRVAAAYRLAYQAEYA